MNIFKKVILGLLVVSTMFLASCASDSDVASENLSRAAEQFEIDRRIVFYNGITGEYMLVIEGLCSVDPAIGLGKTLAVTCKVGEGQFKKHYLGLSDNVTYFVEQLQSKGVSVYHYRVIFKPQSIIPDIDFRGSTSDTPVND